MRAAAASWRTPSFHLVRPITNATGVVVDGTLVGATQESAAINQLLNEQKAPYETGQENLTVRFAHEVERCPWYFTGYAISEDELAARLLGQAAWTLVSGEQVQQNYLTVQQVFRETYEETGALPHAGGGNSDLAWGRVPLQKALTAQSWSQQTWYTRTGRSRAAPSSAKRRWWRPCPKSYRWARLAARPVPAS